MTKNSRQQEIEAYEQSQEHARQLTKLDIKNLSSQDLVTELIKRTEPSDIYNKGDIITENNPLELFKKTDTLDTEIDYIKTDDGDYKPYSITYYDTENKNNFRRIKL